MMMSQPTPMTAYRTLTPATIAIPRATQKPASRMGAIADLVKAGHTPIEAMIMLERRDHRQAKYRHLSTSDGGRGVTRPKREIPLDAAILATLTREWRLVDQAMIEALDAKRDNINRVLKQMAEHGRVECRRAAYSRMEWRVVE